MLLPQAPECIVNPPLADVLPHCVHREGALAVGKVRAVGPEQRDSSPYWRDWNRPPHPAQEPAQMLVAVGFLYNPHRGVPREALGQQPGSLDACVYELSAPPLVRHLVRHYRKHQIEAPRIVLRIQEGEPLLK